MAKNLGNCRTGTRIYLDEASAADFLDSEVDIAINFAYHDVIGHVMEVNDEWYNDVSVDPFTYAIVANQQEYTIDSSIIKPTRVEINYSPTTSGSIPTRAIPLKKDEIRGNLANTSSNGGSFFTAGYYLHGNIGAQKIGFVPIPQVADTTGKSISVWGTILPADLSASSDNVNIPYADRYAYLVNLRAAAQLLRKGQQEENTAQNYINEYEKGIVEMQTFLKDRMADDGQYIIDSQLEQIDFSTTEIV